MAWVTLSPQPQVGGFDVGTGSATTDGTYIWLVVDATIGTLFRYDPNTDTYSSGIPTGRNDSTNLGTDLFYAPASNYGTEALFHISTEDYTTGFTDAFHPADPATGAWSTGLSVDPAGGRYQYAAGWYPGPGTYGNIILVAGYPTGAVIPPDRSDDVDIYDVQADSWTTGAPLPIPNGDVSGCWVGTKFYVFGGWDGTAYTPCGFVYDSILNSWSTLAVPFNSNTAGTPCVVALADNSIIVTGGYGDNPGSDTWRYDTVNNVWSSEASLPFATYYAVATSINQTIFVWSANDSNAASLTLPVLNSTNARPGRAAGIGDAFSPSPRRNRGSFRWTFQDMHTGVVYSFEINPNEGGSPELKRTMTTTLTTAPTGKPLIFEGANEVPSITWSGTLFENAQLQTYRTWYAKRHSLLLTDDLDRQYVIVITDFEPKRARSSYYPYKHTYTVKAVILDWPT